MKKIQIELTEREAELLSSLLTTITGCVQYRATKIAHLPNGKQLDTTWEVWQKITTKIAQACGFNALCKPSVHISRALAVIKEKL